MTTSTRKMMSLAVLHNNIGALLQQKGATCVEEATKHYHDSIAASGAESSEDPAHRAGLSWFHRKLQAEKQSSESTPNSGSSSSMRRASSLARANSGGLNAHRRRSSIVQTIDHSPELSSHESTPLGLEYYCEPLLVTPDTTDSDAAAASWINLALLSYLSEENAVDLDHVMHLLKKAKTKDCFIAAVRESNLGVILFRLAKNSNALKHVEAANQKTASMLDDDVRIHENDTTTSILHEAQEQLYLRMAVLLNQARICVRINDVKKAVILCDEISVASLAASHKQSRPQCSHHRSLSQLGSESFRSSSFSHPSPSNPRSVLQISPANPRAVFQMSPSTHRSILQFTPDVPKPILQLTPENHRSLSQLSPATYRSLLVPSPMLQRSVSHTSPVNHRSIPPLPVIPSTDRRQQSFSQVSHTNESHRTVSQKMQHRIYWISKVASIYIMAMVYQREEDLKQALDLYRQFLARARHQLGHSHLHVASVLYMRGMALFDKRKLHHAMLAQLASMQILELHPRGNPTELARVMYSIGRTLHDREEYNDALSMYQRTLRLQIQLKPDSFEAVTTMCNIARVYHICGELDPCLDMNQKIVRLTRRLTGGKAHPFLADRFVVLGNVLLEAGQTSEAMDAFASAARAGGGEHIRSSSYDVDTRSAKFLGRVGLQHPGAASA